MDDLGSRQQRARLNPNNPHRANGWTATFDPQVLSIPSDFIVYHMALRNGPPGSAMFVYVGDVFYSVAARGDINEWDPSQPMYVQRGQTLHFHWNLGTGSAPVVSIFCRQPSLL